MRLAAMLRPEFLREYSDGLLTSDDTRLTGVTLELRDALGLPVTAHDLLPGHYADEPFVASTDAVGFYEFTGLRPGTYHVYQRQPDGFVDGIDTAGSTGGQPINVADNQSEQLRSLLAGLSNDIASDPGSDAILNISLAAGEGSEHNNFSELRVVKAEVPQQPTEPVARLPQIVVPIETFDPTIRIATFVDPITASTANRIYDEWAVSWHLSVINGGFPRVKKLTMESFVVRVQKSQSGMGSRCAHRWSVDHSGDRGP